MGENAKQGVKTQNRFVLAHTSVFGKLFARVEVFVGETSTFQVKLTQPYQTSHVARNSSKAGSFYSPFKKRLPRLGLASWSGCKQEVATMQKRINHGSL